MDEIRDATDALLAEKPHLEDGLRSVLAVDAERESWAFEDVPLDSGEFGEVVSRGLVEKHGDEYRVTDRSALAEALDVEQPGGADRSAFSPAGLEDGVWTSLGSLLPSVDRRVAVVVGLALGLVVLFRIVPYGAVFRGQDVVLSSNDPYAYRYVVERMAAEASGPLDFAVLSDLPGRMSHQEPLFVATLWWVIELLGGGARTAGIVLAWYPVASAILTAALVYVFATRVTNDRRVGLAAVSFLAITPLHAIRTGVGFADHHPFDYPWLVLTALALVALVDVDFRSRRTWSWSAVLAAAVTAQVLAWDNGPLLLVPLALYAWLRTVSDVRAGESPVRRGVPVAAGVAVAATVVQLAHVGLGWQTGVVAATPAVLLVGLVGVLLAAEGARYLGGSAGQLVVLQGAGAIAIVPVIVVGFPSFASEASRGIDRLTGMGGIVESSALFGGGLEGLIGPLVYFGFVLLIAVTYMTWAGVRTYRKHDPALLVATTYAWFFFGLTTLQIRFAGEFAPFAALFAGLGFVHVAAWVDLTGAPIPFSSEGDLPAGSDGRTDRDLEWPERRTVAYTAGLWMGIGSLGSTMSVVKHSQITTGDDEYEVARWIAEDAQQRGLEYPENYVLSHWGDNRLYNYFANGESLSYAYARWNYASFLRSTDPASWFDRFEGRVGYVVVDPGFGGGLSTAESTYMRLMLRYGSRNESGPGTGHFRARYVSPDGRTVFEPVPGAVLAGSASETVQTVSTDVSIDGASFTYERRPRIDGGQYRVRVAYPGQYEFGDDVVDVSEAAVRSGETIDVS